MKAIVTLVVILTAFGGSGFAAETPLSRQPPRLLGRSPL